MPEKKVASIEKTKQLEDRIAKLEAELRERREQLTLEDNSIPSEQPIVKKEKQPVIPPKEKYQMPKKFLDAIKKSKEDLTSTLNET